MFDALRDHDSLIENENLYGNRSRWSVGATIRLTSFSDWSFVRQREIAGDARNLPLSLLNKQQGIDINVSYTSRRGKE